MSGFDDKELFESAIADETPAEQPVVEQAQVQAEAGQQRDAHGRYAAVQSEAEPQEQTTEPNEPQPQDNGDQPVPGKRFGEVTRARDEAIRRAEEAERRAQDYEARIRSLEAQRQPAQPQQPAAEQIEPIDMLLTDPDGFLRQREDQNQQLIGAMMVDMQPGGQEARMAAFQALQSLQATNPGAHHAASVQIMNTPPLMRARALVEWHKSYETQQRVGNDPEAFFSRTLEERLSKDPDFAKSLVEKLTGQARQATPANGDKPLLNLPPSLSRATAAAPNAGAGLPDLSDAAIFAEALRS